MAGTNLLHPEKNFAPSLRTLDFSESRGLAGRWGGGISVPGVTRVASDGGSPRVVVDSEFTAPDICVSAMLAVLDGPYKGGTATENTM